MCTCPFIGSDIRYRHTRCVRLYGGGGGSYTVYRKHRKYKDQTASAQRGINSFCSAYDEIYILVFIFHSEIQKKEGKKLLICIPARIFVRVNIFACVSPSGRGNLYLELKLMGFRTVLRPLADQRNEELFLS